MRKGGWRPAADNRWGLVDELVILDGLHHEQGIVHAARDVAFKDGVTDVQAPHRQSLAFTLFEAAPTHDRPLCIAGKHPAACFHLVVDVQDAK